MRIFLLSVAVLFCLTGAAAARDVAAKLEGQVVCCADCWAKADRRTTPYGTPPDLAAAARCVANGDPTLLAVMDAEGRTTFYQLEEGKFRRAGKDWLEYVGKRVEVTGAVRSKKEKNFIKVDALNVLSAPATAQAPVVIGTEAELVLKDLFGVEQKLSANRGRIVVLNFWATYCAPCRKEMPDLAAIQNDYAALGVQVVGASAETLEDRPKVLQFVKETKLNFPVWLGATTADMARFGLGPELPGTAIVNREGKIVASIRGVIKGDELKRQIEALLAADEREAKEQVAAAKPQPVEASTVPS